MTNLEEFYEGYLTEAARKKKAEEPFPEDPKKLAKDPRIVNAVDAEDVAKSGKLPKKGPGKPGKGKIGDDGQREDEKSWYFVDPPAETWEADLAKFTQEELDKLPENQYFLHEKFLNKEDFMVVGEAGWSKTASILAAAHKYGYHVLTVYLDKAVATDLGGIPVPNKEVADGEDVKDLYMNYAMPPWAMEMLMHPKNKYLVFFDEMNQAAPDVMNALMPIILEHVVCSTKFNNMLVGCAGNLQHENENGVNELSGPLASRLDIYEWEIHTKDSWAPVWEWMHEKFDEKIGSKVIDKLKELENVWLSPREVTRYMLETIAANRSRDGIEGGAGNKTYRPSSIQRRLKKMTWPKAKIDREQEEKMEELVDYISQYIKTGGKSAEEDEMQDAGMHDIDPKNKKLLMDALEKGYFYFDDGLIADKDGNPLEGDHETYLVSLDNCIANDEHGIFPGQDWGVTAEVLNQIVEEMEDAGKQVRFNEYNSPAAKKAAKEEGLTIAFMKDDAPLVKGNATKNATKLNVRPADKKQEPANPKQQAKNIERPE